MSAAGGYITAIEQGAFDGTLDVLYGEDQRAVQRQRYLSLLRRMEKWSPAGPATLISAPGRTELGGNHTDHNDGVVLAAAVHLDCLAVAAPNGTNVVRIKSEGFSELIEVELSELAPRPEEEGASAALVRGVAHGFQAADCRIGGFDACISSEVPVGSGLSSSAAFEVCLGQIFNRLFNNGMVAPISLARIGRTAENLHFGKPCGFMDQIACAVQGVLSIDFAEQRNPAVTPVDFDFGATEYQLCVVDTGGDHADLTPEYAAIPDEMGRAAQVLGQETARGLTMSQVLRSAAEIRRQVGDRALLRLIHFIEESDRAQEQARALGNGDMDRFLSLVNASGDSSWRLLQNCVSTTDFLEQNIPVALTLTERFLGGKGAWRVQGGGFAGTIQAFVPKPQFAGYREFMESVYGKGAVVPLKVRMPGHDMIVPTDGEA